MRKLNTRLVAFCLLLLFSQKGGARLWLHVCLHARTSPPHSSNAIHWERAQPQCNCMDDLMLPMTAAGPIELSPPDKDYVIYIAVWSNPLLSPIRHCPSLRGPPATDC
jgi:hypothetical protein